MGLCRPKKIDPKGFSFVTILLTLHWHPSVFWILHLFQGHGKTQKQNSFSVIIFYKLNPVEVLE